MNHQKPQPEEGVATILSCFLLLLLPVVTAGLQALDQIYARPQTRMGNVSWKPLRHKTYAWAHKPKPPLKKTNQTKKVAAARHAKLPVNCLVQKCIALTFDDGPSPFTPHLLDYLRQRQISATFFMLGMYAERYPAIVRQVARDGHQIGNHTWDHHQLTTLAPADAKGEIDRTSALLQHLTGRAPHIMRPPYGSTDAMVASVTTLPQILWSIDPFDWRDKDSQMIADRVVGAAQPGGIVLSHDIYPTTVEAVPQIIDRLRPQGYVFVTIDELLGAPLPPGEYRHRS